MPIISPETSAHWRVRWLIDLRIAQLRVLAASASATSVFAGCH